MNKSIINNLRCAALAQCSVFETSVADVDQFAASLAHNIEILDATVSMRASFEEIVSSQDNMRVIHLPTWAGLGVVQSVCRRFFLVDPG